jgi:hypothetical protein
LYFFYEVYDPGQDTRSKTAATARVLSSVSFFQGKTRVYETDLVEARTLGARDRNAVVVQLDVPLAQLKPGFYTCQVNVVDDVAGKFLFPRLALLVRQ